MKPPKITYLPKKDGDEPDTIGEEDVRASRKIAQYTTGVLIGLLSQATKLAAFCFVVWALVTIIANSLSLGTDDSDMDGWHRSGMAVHTDNLTGIQYLSVPGGGVTPRLDKDGRPMRSSGSNSFRQ